MEAWLLFKEYQNFRLEYLPRLLNKEALIALSISHHLSDFYFRKIKERETTKIKIKTLWNLLCNYPYVLYGTIIFDNYKSWKAIQQEKDGKKVLQFDKYSLQLRFTPLFRFQQCALKLYWNLVTDLNCLLDIYSVSFFPISSRSSETIYN